MSESKKGTKQSEETIRKRGESRARTVAREDYVSPLKGKYAGKKNPYYGKTHSEEVKRKISVNAKKAYAAGHQPWNKGKKAADVGMPPPWNKGKKGVYNKETLKKMSEVMKKKYKMGYVHPMQGTKQSEKSKSPKTCTNNYLKIDTEKVPENDARRVPKRSQKASEIH